MPQVKDRKKFEMSQPEVMAAYYASLKSIFERFDWPTSPKGAAVAPSKSLCMWDEIAFMSRDGTVERVVKCGGSKPTVPSGGVGTDQSFHFTIFAGVNASGIALPPFCVFDQKTWSTGFDDGMGTGGTRLAGVPMEWSFANTKSGSMTKSKGYGDTNALFVLQPSLGATRCSSTRRHSTRIAHADHCAQCEKMNG